MTEKIKETSALKTAVRVILTFIFTAAVCMVLLFITALIPKERIADSVKESADYFYEQELFPCIIDKQFNTRQDNYADSILVNIMYHISAENPMHSLIKAAYYNPEMENVNVSLYESMQEDKEPNVEYSRYWHGGMVLLRPLFVFTGIEGARMLLGIALFALTAAVSIILWKKKERLLSVCYILANLIVQVWVCAFCVEYITTFLIMNAVILILLFLFYKRRSREEFEKNSMYLMAAAGVCTCFFDFLTTETITITVPLLIILILKFHADELEDMKSEIIHLVRHGIIWGASYGGMFLLKWLIAAVVLGKAAFLGALTSAGERIGGTVRLGNTNLDPEADGLQRFVGALASNQGCLFPFREIMSTAQGMFAFGGIVFLCFCIIYLFRGKNFSPKFIALCMLLSCVPYVRYIVIANHAYIHYFFTYRAQIVTIIALLFCTIEFGIHTLVQTFAGKKNRK